MSFSRACLISLPLSGALIAAGLAQSLPAGLTRNGDVVMMQPIADATGATGSSTTRQSRLRFLTHPERDIFSRAFDAAERGGRGAPGRGGRGALPRRPPAAPAGRPDLHPRGLHHR